VIDDIEAQNVAREVDSSGNEEIREKGAKKQLKWRCTRVSSLTCYPA
jgi:hypothetical protein